MFIYIKNFKTPKDNQYYVNKITKIKLFLIFFIILFPFSFLSANENCKKYDLSVCCLFKNDAKTLKDWIDYHRTLGVDHFYMYDMGSQDQYKKVLQPYIDNEIVTLVHWPIELCRKCEDCDDCKFVLASQIPAYENAVNFLAKEETEWLIFLEANENLICSESLIKNLLLKYESYSGITCSSYYFDSNQAEPFADTNDLIKSLELKPSTEKTVTKMIFKPSHSQGFTWAPYQCRFSETQATTEVAPNELCVNRFLKQNDKVATSRKAIEHKKIFDLTSKSISYPMYQKMPELLKKIIHNNKEID